MDPEHPSGPTPDTQPLPLTQKFDRTFRILAQRAGYATIDNARELFDTTQAAKFIRTKTPEIVGKLSTKELVLGGLAIGGGAAIALAVIKAVTSKDKEDKEWDNAITAGISAKLDAVSKGEDDPMATPLPDEQTLDAIDNLTEIFFPDPADEQGPRRFRQILHFVRGAISYMPGPEEKGQTQKPSRE